MARRLPKGLGGRDLELVFRQELRVRVFKGLGVYCGFQGFRGV